MEAALLDQKMTTVGRPYLVCPAVSGILEFF